MSPLHCIIIRDWFRWYLNGLVVFPTFFNFSLNLAIRSSWSEPQSTSGLVFADRIELLIFGCREYNQSDFGVDHLVMSMCRVFPCVFGRGCLLWPVHSFGKFRLKLKKVGKTTNPFRYDLNQVPYDYIVEVTNRFEGLDLIECLMNYGWGSWHCAEDRDQDNPQEKEMQKSKMSVRGGPTNSY